MTFAETLKKLRTRAGKSRYRLAQYMIIVRIDPSPDIPTDRHQSFRDEISRGLQIGLGIRVAVEMAPSGSLPRWDHKAKRVVDERVEVPF